MTNYAIGQSAWNTQAWNGLSKYEGPAAEHFILFNTTSIVLNWTGIDTATSYQLQVSMFPDFRSTFVDTTVNESNYSFTDGQVDDAKRYWRWRPNNGVIYFEPWSEVGSYWVDTGAISPIELDYEQWAIVDINDTNDIYLFDLFPVYMIVPQNLLRIQERNRLGDLLSEFLTVKGMIQLNYTGKQYTVHKQLNEFRRFHNNLRTFYLCTFKDGEWHQPMPHIWKVEFSDDPIMTMLTAGRQDLVTGTLTLQEV